MHYDNIVEGHFIERPNRFVAKVEIDGRVETVHVKNTGRCRELLLKGTAVFLEECGRPGRSTAFDLVAVKKGSRLINMDSQAPNRAVGEWLSQRKLFSEPVTIRPETKYGNSRFDFYVETPEEKIFIEVKGVTLEREGVVLFPDAPSERAVKHVEELMAAKRDGYRVFVLFVIQMENVRYFTPNRATHPEFAEALCRASREGVEILAYDCIVTEDSMRLNHPVEVRMGEEYFPEEEHFPKENKCPEDKNLPEENLPEEFTEISANVKETLSQGELSAIPKPLLKWYDKNKRVLPWREDPKPYRVWVSEIMLQQTRVEAVKPYFQRFMQAFPDIASLAEAEEEQVLKLWEGLGYYSRARNLQKAARQIQEEYQGRMPGEYDKLLKLAGIGSYTAGAVASIAYGKPVPAVDGNVLRVIARFRSDGRLMSDQKVKASVEEDLSRILPKDRPGDFNQALMELGACVCVPNGGPVCGSCPLEDICMAHREGKETEYPRKAGKPPRKIDQKTVLVVRRGQRVAIRKRSKKGLLAGMYELPSLEGFCSLQEIVEYLAENGIRVLRIQELEPAKHIFTHREWHMKGYMVRVDELAMPDPEKNGDWLYIEPWETKERYPIPSAFGAYMKCVKNF